MKLRQTSFIHSNPLIHVVSCCMGGTTVMFLHKLLPGGKWSLIKVINGCLIGDISTIQL